ncbi:acyl carrier protein [Promicromonospora thailandica]|uniref:Acyl carrier protein n=1 Tax=Promicromonospora thailandica TaxID=765201 RepID=A0A9X2JW91_9MICO|nr:acyl carrier protein [Promicromonospora thailandica]MCP2264888.1 Acyl carrier protein [Promicromonospora thailandica]BFF18845.1 acyl carrier protein [Promicromonospora thailandica]
MSSDTTTGPATTTEASAEAGVTLADVLDVLGTTLGIEDRVGTFDAATPLFGTLPELDSLAVLELVTAVEDRFGITVDEEDLGGGLLETAGSLHDYVRDRVR